MSRLLAVFSFLTRAIIAGLALAFLLLYFWPNIGDRLGGDTKASPRVVSYADAVNRAAPAVVSIYTRSLQPRPVDPAMEQKFGFKFLYRMQQNMASGVLFSEDGYILTNHHVVAKAQSIRIALWDGRIVPARVIGTDPATDLAVLKVGLTGLPVVPVARQPVRVGDVVLAIGNALGLSNTVTMGIVSATGRNDLRSLVYEDFIQTDAAINVGNSGGALVNAAGELVGINTRNLDAAQGAQNIGFAIPVGLAKNVMKQIIEYGTVRRGWLGASYSDIRPMELPDGSARRLGIGVREVYRNGPAWNAGIRQGDVILAVDGEEVSDASQFVLAISQRKPGSTVELTVKRGKQTFQTYATLIQQPPLQ